MVKVETVRVQSSYSSKMKNIKNEEVEMKMDVKGEEDGESVEYKSWRRDRAEASETRETVWWTLGVGDWGEDVLRSGGGCGAFGIGAK